MADILVIDDDAFMLELIGSVLEDFGHSVRAVADGDSGLRETARAVPQLVILDMNMPQMDGYAVARRLKSAEGTRSVPILALTARSDIDDYQKAYAAGCDGFLAKPVDAARLGEKVRLMLMLPPARAREA